MFSDPVGLQALAIFVTQVTTTTQTAHITFGGGTTTSADAGMLYYTGATHGFEPTGPQTFSSGNSTAMTANPITTTAANRMAIYGAAWASNAGTPLPPGFTNRGVVTSGPFSIILADQLQLAAQSVTATGTLGAAVPWSAGLVAVF